MSRLILICLVAFALATTHCVVADDFDWWKTTVFYQIYPRSFKDNDGDGVGDLQGITSKMEHLKDLGVGGMWMSPMFASPMADFGYDISDYRAIDPLFGTMDDFDRLMRKAVELGIKIILDFVPNHTSDEHLWFQRSSQNTIEYDEFYIWRDPIGTNATGDPIPPNEWIGSFNEPVWKYHPLKEKFYYHRFNVKQPDLNYRSEDVRNEMKDVLRFWLDKGVSGFRVDAISALVEDPSFPNVPNEESGQYCFDQPMTYEMVQDWRTVLEEYTEKDNVTRVMMLETGGRQQDLLPYFGNETFPGTHFTFNMQFIHAVHNDSKAQDYVDMIHEWNDFLPKDSSPNWVIGNHDSTRVASRFGTDLAAGIAMLSLLLPGIGIVYNGEEIGMVNNWDISYEDTQDPAGINAGEEGYMSASRDFERTPFQWDDTKNAGFSTGDETWLPLNPNFRTVNLASERDIPNSYFNIYKKLIEARQTDTVKTGSYQSVAISEKVLVLSRELEGATTYIVVVNLGDAEESVDLNGALGTSLDNLYVYTANVASQWTLNDTVQAGSLVLLPKASVVLTSSASAQFVVNFLTLLASLLGAFGLHKL